MLVNILLLAFAVALILRALRVRVRFERIPFPPEAPAGLFGFHAMVVRIPAGVGFMHRTQCRQVADERTARRDLH